jgi:hypothetical protein
MAAREPSAVFLRKVKRERVGIFAQALINMAQPFPGRIVKINGNIFGGVIARGVKFAKYMSPCQR